MVRHNRLKLIECPNCGYKLSKQDNFCPQCGQKNHDLKVPLKHLLMEVVEDLVHFDGKMFITLQMLLFHPGQLTNEFRVGRRIRYVQPIRLYVFISFVFFFLLAFKSGHEHSATSEKVVADSTGEIASTNSLKVTFFGNLSSDELRGLSNTQLDSALDDHGVEKTTLNRYLARQLSKIANGGQEQFNHLLMKGVSNMMFVLMPFFALLLFLFYRKQSELYLDNLVFSIHFHCFLFLLFTAMSILGWLVDTIYLFPVVLILTVIYFLKALRTFYNQSKGWTFLKATAISILHACMISTCLLILIFISVAIF